MGNKRRRRVAHAKNLQGEQGRFVTSQTDASLTETEDCTSSSCVNLTSDLQYTATAAVITVETGNIEEQAITAESQIVGEADTNTCGEALFHQHTRDSNIAIHGGTNSLYTLLTSQVISESVDVNTCQSICLRINIPYNHVRAVTRDLPVSQCLPICCSVPGDGDCGFASMAFVVGLNPSRANKLKLRGSICDYISSIQWNEGELEAFVPTAYGNTIVRCSTAEEYLQYSEMCNPGVYATDVEFKAFATQHNLQVVVYQAQLQSWISYEPHGSVQTDVTTRRAVYFRHSMNHWDPVISFTTNSDCDTSSEARMTKVSRRREPTVAAPVLRRTEIDHTPIVCEPIVRETGSRKRTIEESSSESTDSSEDLQFVTDTLDEEDVVFHKSTHYTGSNISVTEQGNFCDKCLRCATETLPLIFVQKDRDTVSNTWFGAGFGTKTVLNLCELCEKYSSANSETSKYKKWEYAWPAVLISMLIDKRIPSAKVALLYSWISDELRLSWDHIRHYFHPHLLHDPPKASFEDITQRRQDFQDNVNSMEGIKISKALDDECYPSCRCPFGCFAFIEEEGSVQFNHLLNCLFPTFTSFNSSYMRYLRGMRRDFLVKRKCLGRFQISACTRVSLTSGLVIQTCKEHNNGSNLQYIHPPTNPTLSRTPSMRAERLGFLVPSLRQLKTGRANFSSHTFQLFHAKGGYNGISSTTLTKRRRWDVTSDILAGAEAQCVYGRSDIRANIQSLASQGEITPTLVTAILKKAETCSAQQSNLALAGSTNVSLVGANTVNPNDSQMVTQDASFCIGRLQSLIFAQPTGQYGATPMETKTIPDKEIWLLLSATCISPQLCSILGDIVTQNLALLPLAQFICRHLFGGYEQWPVHARNAIDTFESTCSHMSEKSAAERVSCFLQTSGKIQHVVVSTTNEIASIVPDQDIIVVTRNSNSSYRYSQLPSEFTYNNVGYELRCVSQTKTRECKDWKSLVRHGRNIPGFWLLDNKSISPRKQKLDINELLDDQFKRGNWDLAVYYKMSPSETDELRKTYLTQLTGGGKFVCGKHNIPLTKDFPNSGFRCSCGKVSAIRCSEYPCTAAICKQHYSESLQDGETGTSTILPSPETSTGTTAQPRNSLKPVSDDDESACTVENQSNFIDSDGEENDSEDNLDNNFVNFVTDSGVCEAEENDSHITVPSTDSGARQQYFIDTSTDNDLPLHVLLNGHCGLLQRSGGNPISLASRHRRVIENLVATSPQMSTPTLYPESMIYPSIFWKQNNDASYPGAIPSVLMNSGKNNKKMGFAGMEQMLRTRLKDGTLQTSTSPHYQAFAFDSIFNQLLDRGDSRLILHRGWEELAAKSGKTVSSEGRMRMESNESYRNVRELGAALSNENATYFWTYTCNQSEHPGVKPIFEALRDVTHSNGAEETNATIQGELQVMLRAWERSSRIFMRYIESSHEQPLGPVKKIWYRYEFQDKTGAFPHIHALIWTGEDQHSTSVKERVVCAPATFLGETNKFLEKVANRKMTDEEFVRNWELYESIQSHSCEKARWRCHKKTDKLGRSMCRVPKYTPSFEYGYEEVHHVFSHETKEILLKLGLAHIDPITNIIRISPALTGGKHSYPTDKGVTISPTSAIMFYLTKSSSNLQICDKYMSARYIAKYAAGIEERASMSIISTGDTDTYKVKSDDIKNVKIAGVKATEERKMRDERKRTHLNGRVLSLTESLWFSLQLPYVSTNMEFVHVPTVSKEFRTGVLIGKEGYQDAQHGEFVSEADRIRRQLHLPHYRQFTTNQLALLEDISKSSLTPDKISIFGVRPPELRYVDSPIRYFKWFCREAPRQKLHNSSVHEQLLRADAWLSPLIDGLGKIVKLRSDALTSFMDFSTEAITKDPFKHDVRQNFENFCAACSDENTFSKIVAMSGGSASEAQVSQLT